MLFLDAGADRIYRAYQRFIDILALLLRRPVNRFTENYLARVAGLYIWGFDPEVYVMSRAALDSALKELLPDDALRRTLKWKDAAQIGLGIRIQIARFTSPPLLSDDTWRLAFWLKEDGNDVVHEDPEHHLHFDQSKDAIDALVSVLHALPCAPTSVVPRPWPKDATWRPPSV